MSEMFAVQSSALPSSTKLVAFHGTEGISKLYRFDLYLVMTNDVGHSFDLAAAVGQPVTISLERSDGGEPFLRSGVLGSIKLINDFAGRCVFRATMVPRLALLAMSFHSRVFTTKAIPEIMQAVLQKGGVTDCALQLQGSYAVEEHVCQYRESDYAFVARWMEREGIYYYFEHGESGETLVLVDDRSAHQPFGDKPARYYPQPGGANTAKDTVYAFTCQHDAIPSTVRLKDYNYATPAVPISGQASVSPNGFGEVSLYGARFFSSGAGERLARIKAESLSAAGVVYEVMGNATTLIPGFTFELEDHPRAAFNTKYLATEVEHWSNQAPDMPELRELAPWSGNYRMEAKAIPVTTQFRAPQVTEWPRIYGTEIAIVDGAAASEYAQIDSHGRYRIKFHFDESDLSGGKASTWVRMLQPHGGGIEGFHFPLRAGVEVMCAFEGGDPDRPAIVGVAPNALTPSPVTSGNNTRNVIQTGGRNRLELEDQAGQERVTLSTPYDNTYLRMGAPNGGWSWESKTDGHAFTWVAGSSESMVGVNRTTVTIGASENVVGLFRLSVTGRYSGNFIAGFSQNVILGYRRTTIRGNETTTLHGNRKTTITRNRSTKIGGDDDFTLVGDRSAHIVGNSDLRVLGRRNTSIQGRDKSTFFNGRETTIYTSSQTTVNGTSEVDINGTRRADIRGHATSNFYAGRTTTVHAGGSRKTVRGGNTAEVFGPVKFTLHGPKQSTVNGTAESTINGLYKTTIGTRVEIIRGTKTERINGLAYKYAPNEVKKVTRAEIQAKGLQYRAELCRIQYQLGFHKGQLHLIQ